MSEKTRVHTLAKQLNVTSKVVLEKCRAEGLEIKNHMSTLSAGLEATIREWFSEGAHAMTVETTARVDLKKVRLKQRKRKATTPSKTPDEETGAETGAAVTTVEAPHVLPAAQLAAAGTAPSAQEDAAAVADAPAPTDATAPAPVAVAEAPTREAPPAAEPTAEPPPEVGPSDEEQAATAPIESVPEQTDEPPDELTQPSEPVEPLKPAGPQNVPAPAKLSGPRVVRYEPVEADVSFRPHRSGSPRRRATAGIPSADGPPASTGRRRTPRSRGGEARGAGRAPAARRQGEHRGSDAGEKLHEWRDRDMAEFQERLHAATGRRIQSHRLDARSRSHGGAGTGRATGPVTQAEMSEPIVVKDFCAAIGVPFVRLVGLLKREHNMMPSINGNIPTEVAELVAAEFGVELTVHEAKTSLDLLIEEYAARERGHLAPRPPVITMLGHVDHGKTSLLDAIRRTGVAAGEDGGITQHFGSYHLVRDGLAVTFLDTPGHAAFTAMRARGAQLTDIVVLVVAADDGVMAQTIEAIRHAQAAKVPIVVALNKCDLGDANDNMIYGQLAAQGLNPLAWGGETDIIKTSALDGTGIDELVQHLADLAELLELKADPKIEAGGSVLEAETKEGVGPVATVLVQEGTLRVGEIVVCGGAFGKVRALLNDAGRRIREAGPSIPVEIWGLDDVPGAGDKIHVVDTLQRAGQIANETRQKRAQDSRTVTGKPRSLEDLFKQHAAGSIPELNLIIKADVSGSLSALRSVLAELPSDEVLLNIRHCGVGGITDSDIHLADACDGIIIGFRVAPGAGSRHLAEEKGVAIRRYRVIYEVTDDIKKAMEGMLEPEEKTEPRATAEVRDVFRITKVGMVAGSYVTEGVVRRNQSARLIRDGVIVREGCKLASLRRFKDDVREVRSGMECGIRLEGFDDIKAGDVIETYEIVKVARKLKGV